MLGMFGPVRVVHVGWLLPLSGVHIELDRLGGFFMALTGAVAAPVGCYLIGYVRREHLGRVGSRWRWCRCSSRRCCWCRPRAR